MVPEWQGHAGLGSMQQCRWLAFYIYRSVGSALGRDALMEARELSCGMLGEMPLGRTGSLHSPLDLGDSSMGSPGCPHGWEDYPVTFL